MKKTNLTANIFIIGILVAIILGCSSNTNEEKPNAKIVSEISFTPGKVSTQFDANYLDYYKFQLIEMVTYSNGKMTLKVSICNVGENKARTLYPSLWYTPKSGQQSTIKFDGYIGNSPEVSLQPGACAVKERVGSIETPPFELKKPFGTLFMRFSNQEDDIVSGIDLNEADSKGHVKVKNVS